MNRSLSLLISLSLIWTSIAPALAGFSDVSEFHPNKAAIDFLQTEGIVSGSNGKFFPSRPVNRAEFLKMAVLSSERVLDKAGSLDFSDIDNTQWYFEFVSKAFNHGIVKGYGDKTFQPGRTVNKVEALKMLLKAHRVATEKPTSSPYSDVGRTTWFAEYVSFAKDNSLVDVGGTNFMPDEPMSRAQLAEIIYRLMQLKKQGQVTFEAEDGPTKVETESTTLTSNRKIMTSGSVKHSVPLEDIISGGVPKDGIPSIDNPIFELVNTADEWVDDYEMGIGVTLNGIKRFYPNSILNWHEIVNDKFGDIPVVISYCPLCATGVVFEGRIDGEDVEFGTSGKLWNSNLIMYDRKTETYWSQVLGEAIKGELTGQKLKRIKAENVLWKEWKLRNPKGNVLSRNTGFERDYTDSPYKDYENTTQVFFKLDKEDPTRHPKELVYGVEVNGYSKVYFIEDLDKSAGTFNDLIGDVPVTIKYYHGDKTMRVFRQFTDIEIIPVYGFWFSWLAAYPETDIYENTERF